jgi:hypothetical protein
MTVPEAREGCGGPAPSGGRALLLVAMTTLLLGFAGSATAGVVITGKQIKDGTITSRDLRNGDLRGIDVKDGSLTQAEFDVQIIGMSGPAGDQGQTGSPGTAGLVYSIEAHSVPKGATHTWGAPCPSGTRVLSGGGSADTAGVVQLVETGPVDDAGTGWWVGMRNKTNGAVTGYAWALCVTA